LDRPYGFAVAGAAGWAAWGRFFAGALVWARAPVATEATSRPAAAIRSICNIDVSISSQGHRPACRLDQVLALRPGRNSGFSGPMDTGPTDENTGAAQKSPRNERLAKALRDNLRRRKAQLRERAVNADTPEEAGHPAGLQPGRDD
jgi:hypothetical protein